MNGTIRFFFLTVALLASSAASAAIFDTMESVDQLKVIADQRSTTKPADRMPAGKASEPKEDETKTTDETGTTASPEAKTEKN